MARRLTQVHPATAVRDRVRSLPKRFRRTAAQGIAAEWELHVEDELFTISVIDDRCHVREGPSLAPTFTVSADGETWLKIAPPNPAGGPAPVGQKPPPSGRRAMYQGPEGKGAGHTIASFAKTPFAPEAYYPHRIWLVVRRDYLAANPKPVTALLVAAGPILAVAGEFVRAGPFFVLDLSNGNPIITETNTLQAEEEGSHYRPAPVFASVDRWRLPP